MYIWLMHRYSKGYIPNDRAHVKVMNPLQCNGRLGTFQELDIFTV